MLDALRQFQFLQFLTTVEGAFGQRVVGSDQVGIAERDVRLATLYEACLGEVENLKASRGLLAHRIATCLFAQVAQVVGVDVAGHGECAQHDVALWPLRLDNFSQGAGSFERHVVSIELHGVDVLQADDHVLIEAELIVRRVEQRDVEEAIVVATPSPVHGNQACCVIAVEHEGMSAVDVGIAVGTTIIDGSACGELVVDDVHPLSVAIIVALHASGRFQSEILSQTSGSFLGIGSTTTFCRSAILHVGCHAAVAHERSHSIGLRIVVLSVDIVVEHVVPVVVMLFEVGRHGLAGRVTLRVVDGACANAVFRHLVVVEHLCHSRCHAACEAARPSRSGAVVVVGLILIPLGGHHRRHVGLESQVAGFRCDKTLATLEYALGRLLHGAEPPHEVFVLTIAIACSRHAQHFGQQVVGRYDGESSVFIAEDRVDRSLS